MYSNFQVKKGRHVWFHSLNRLMVFYFILVRLFVLWQKFGPGKDTWSAFIMLGLHGYDWVPGTTHHEWPANRRLYGTARQWKRHGPTLPKGFVSSANVPAWAVPCMARRHSASSLQHHTPPPTLVTGSIFPSKKNTGSIYFLCANLYIIDKLLGWFLSTYQSSNSWFGTYARVFWIYFRIYRRYAFGGNRCSRQQRDVYDDFVNFKICRLSPPEVLTEVGFAYIYS